MNYNPNPAKIQNTKIQIEVPIIWYSAVLG